MTKVLILPPSRLALGVVALIMMAASSCGSNAPSLVQLERIERDFWSNASLSDVQYKLDQGADVNGKDNLIGNTLLHFAAWENQDPEVIASLLDRGADIHAKSNTGWTPLHLAAWENKNPEVIALLLERGADLHIRDKSRPNRPGYGSV